MNPYEIFLEMEKLLDNTDIKTGISELSITPSDRQGAECLVDMLMKDKNRIVKQYPRFITIFFELEVDSEYKLALKSA